MNQIFQWDIKSFNELSNEELYQILRFRMEIFMIEQQSIYLDLDNDDQKAYHFCGKENEKLVAYSRVSFLNENAYIQRVAVHHDYRHQKLGSLIIKNMMEFIEKKLTVQNVKLNAQQHLQLFYEKHGFKVTGQAFDDGGIWHVPMLKKIIN